jgi:hypothetical protein
MRMKRTAILVVSLLLATTTVALAATWQTGNYAGHTKALYCVKFKNGSCKKFAKGKVSFRVNATTIGAAANAKHGQIKFQVREKCADKTFSNWPVRINGEGPIDSNGKFSSSVKTAKGTGRDQFKGKVSGSNASGQLRRFDKEDHKGRENKNGVKCDSGWVKWSAKLQ